MALTYSAQVKITKDEKSTSQTFNNLNIDVDTDEAISSFGTAYAALFDSDVTLSAAYAIRKRTWSAAND